MKQTIKSLVLLALALTAVGRMHAQVANEVRVSPEKESEFRKALSAYLSRDYRDAFVEFEALSNSPYPHQRMTATLLMTGKSLYQLDRFRDALPYFDKLIKSYPQSKYVDDAYYARATALYRLGRYFDSGRSLTWILDNSRDERLVAKASKLLDYLVRNTFSVSEGQDLLQYTTTESAAALITTGLARKEIEAGAAEEAIAVLNEFKNKYKNSKYLDRIDKLLDKARQARNRPVKVGVVLPLTGVYQEQGLGVLRGIDFAYMQTKDQSPVPVQLVVRDSESRLIKAIRATNELIRRQRVPVIVGELESEATAAIGAIASLQNVTVVAPTATENEVASVGDAIFQLNSDLERKGQELARYAFNQLGLRTFATLAPADPYGEQMTTSFTSTIDELGGRIIAQTWYYGNVQDLSRQFKAIREAAFAYDSTDVEALIQEARENNQNLDEKDIPVESIDAIFMPVYVDDIKYVAPQFALANIRAQILGGEYWDDLETLTAPQIQRYVDGAIFVSDYYPDETNPDFRSFRRDFRLKMKRTPERWEVFGYDAYNIIQQAIQRNARTGREFKQRMMSLRTYAGMKGLISFKGSRHVNNAVNFLQFINGRIIKHSIDTR